MSGKWEVECLKKRITVMNVNALPAASLAALGAAARALLQDAQERLVFRAHVHLRADVLLYRAAPGDLAYPDKLLMMEVRARMCSHIHTCVRVGLY